MSENTPRQPAVRQLRLVVEAEDYDAALTFYRDVLGLPEHIAYADGEDDRVAILDAMFGTEDFQGLLGTWSFLDTGDTSLTTVSLNQIKDGAITFIEEIAAPAAE